jgi:hypothetical protein
MSKASGCLPAGFHTLTVHLTVDGTAQYIEFLKRAFNAVEITRSSSPDGRVAVRLTVYLPDADAAWAKAIAARRKKAFGGGPASQA